jgi:hypothetical protein
MGLRPKLKILVTIVIAHSVLVMDLLVGQKCPPKTLLHNGTMKRYTLSIAINDPIPTRINCSEPSTALSLERNIRLHISGLPVPLPVSVAPALRHHWSPAPLNSAFLACIGTTVSPCQRIAIAKLFTIVRLT